MVLVLLHLDDPEHWFQFKLPLVRNALGSNGLYVGYAAYPGEPDSSNVPRFRIDLVHVNEAKRDNAQFFELLDQQIDAAQACQALACVPSAFMRCSTARSTGPADRVLNAAHGFSQAP